MIVILKHHKYGIASSLSFAIPFDTAALVSHVVGHSGDLEVWDVRDATVTKVYPLDEPTIPQEQP